MKVNETITTIQKVQQPAGHRLFKRNINVWLSQCCWCLGLGSLLLLSAPTLSAAETNLAPPVLWLSINQQARAEIGQGWPLLVSVQVLNEQLMRQPGSEQIQLLTSTTTNWPDSLALQVADPSGISLQWPLQLANEAAGPLALTCDTTGQTGWWITPEVTATLAPGSYRLQLVLNTTNSVEGWHGTAKSQVVEVAVREGSGPWSDDSAAEMALRESEYQAWQGNLRPAIALLDSLLAQQPALIPVLSRKADLLLATGAEAEATLAYESALEQFFSANAGTEAEPPARLLRNRKALLAKTLFAPQRTFVPVRAFVTNDGHMALQWSAQAGKKYQVESSTDLTNWTLKTDPITGADELQVWTTTLIGNVHFFRIAVLP